MSGEEIIRTTAGELASLLTADAIMGEAIDTGDKVIIPVAGFGFGFGAGEANSAKEGEGGGGGAGGGVTPEAIIVIHKTITGPDGIQVLSFKKTNPISEVISTLGETVIPHVADLIKSRTGEEKKAEKEITQEETAETE